LIKYHKLVSWYYKWWVATTIYCMYVRVMY
jgi:hypothetical protein